jgi:prepilin-type processing-associated H-X9-DG protein
VVVAIIALLLAIISPSLRKIRSLTKRLYCQTNLRQIVLAWHLYLEAYDGAFYRDLNANHDFGGWIGNGGIPPDLDRPLNKYVDLPLNIETDEGAQLFRCPADSGGIFGPVPEQELAYQFFGNSYQANIILIGPTAIGWGTPELAELNDAITLQSKNLKLSRVSASWSHVSLVGDNNWMSEWHPLIPLHGKAWHGKPLHHNVAFLDGHVSFIRIYKGLYVTTEYSILPFRNLYKLAREVQEEVEIPEENE